MAKYFERRERRAKEMAKYFEISVSAAVVTDRFLGACAGNFFLNLVNLN